MKVLIILCFIWPFVLVLVGGMLKKHPVTDMSKQNGYNTPTSRKSQAHWDYAQSIAPDIFILTGKILFAILAVASIILIAVDVSAAIAEVVVHVIGLTGTCLAFYRTEKMINEKFAEE